MLDGTTAICQAVNLRDLPPRFWVESAAWLFRLGFTPERLYFMRAQRPVAGKTGLLDAIRPMPALETKRPLQPVAHPYAVEYIAGFACARVADRAYGNQVWDWYHDVEEGFKGLLDNVWRHGGGRGFAMMDVYDGRFIEGVVADTGVGFRREQSDDNARLDALLYCLGIPKSPARSQTHRHLWEYLALNAHWKSSPEWTASLRKFGVVLNQLCAEVVVKTDRFVIRRGIDGVPHLRMVSPGNAWPGFSYAFRFPLRPDLRLPLALKPVPREELEV
jgi:hypothetical protein